MLGSKGVSPVLATILIVLITIAVAGSFLVYINAQQSQLEETGAEQVGEIGERFATSFEISSVSCSGSTDTVVVKNLGQRTLNSTTITYLVDGVIVTAAPTFTASGGATCTVTNVAEGCILQAQWATNPIAAGNTVSVQVDEASESATCQ